MGRKIFKFSQMFNEQFIKSIRKDLKAEFETVDLKTPYVAKIITREAEKRNQTVKEITKDLQARLDKKMKSYDGANERANAVTKKNMIESILFDYITPSDAVPKITLKQLKEMIKWIRVSNPAFFKLKDPVTGKRVKISVHITPAPSFMKQPEWMKDVTTAAATATGDLIFNVNFCKQLIQYAYTKGVRPQGGMYESNGGPIPDSYCYIEFLILHEIYHIVHADHFYGSFELARLMVAEGPTRWPKLMKSAGWNGEINTKKGKRSLRKAAKRANGKIQNFVGDWITNYELVKKGYAQLPIGLFATDYNYDHFDSMEDIQIAVLDDIEEETSDKKEKSMLDELQDKMDQQDTHLDSDNNNTDPDERGDGNSKGGNGAGGAPDFADDPDEDDIAKMSPEELRDMLNKMAENQGGGEGEPLDEEDLADMQSIQDAIEDRIEEIMDDPNVSDEEKEALQDAMDKQEQSDSNPGNSGEQGDDGEEDEEGESQGGGQAGGQGEQKEGGDQKPGKNSSAGNKLNDEKEKDKETQEKIDDAMKQSNEDGDSMSADERNELDAETVEEKIKELEAEAEAEEDKRNSELEAAKEKRREQRERDSKKEGELKKPAQPINWKILLKKMVPKPITIEEESITRMHNRTKSALAASMDSKDNDGVAVKAGIIKDEKNEQKLLFVLDNSGSMAKTISTVNPDIRRVIDKSKKMGVKDMFIIKFDSDWDVYKIDLDPKGKKHKFRQFKNQKDIVKKASDLGDEQKVKKLLNTDSRPIEELFKEQWGGGTIFPIEMSKIILELVSGRSGNYNAVMFTDTDINSADNMAVLKKIVLKASKKPFSFNIILNNRDSFNKVKPKLSGYKYISYIGNKELQE